MFMKIAASAAAVLAAVAGFAAGAAAQAPTPEVKLAEKIVCPSINESNLSQPEIEAECLPRLGGAVVRDGEVLRVALRNGTTKAFKDGLTSCQQSKDPNACYYYVLRGYYPQNDAVVVERWLDGPTSFLLGAYMVERGTGRVLDIPREPYYSPDGSRFVSIFVCFDHCANRIDIWSIQDGAAKLEWRRRVKQGEQTYYYAFIEWQGNEQVKFRIYPEGIAEGDAGKPLLQDQAVDGKLVRSGQGWTLETPSMTEAARGASVPREPVTSR